MRYHDVSRKVLFESAIPKVSQQEAKDRQMLGPVYHGTAADMEGILANGFDAGRSIPSAVSRLTARPSDTAHGMPFTEYAWGLPAPIHWLGFGTYFTTVKASAKTYAGGSAKGMKTFYLDVPEYDEINFGSPNTMMKWWVANGYNMTAEALQRRDMSAWVDATHNLTNQLAKHGAMHYLGKGLRKLLDGDQICVYDPSRIYVLDKTLASGLEVGATVTHNQSKSSMQMGKFGNQLYVDTINAGDKIKPALAGWKALYKAVDHDGNDVGKHDQYPMHFIPPPGMKGIITEVRLNPQMPAPDNVRYDVKWAKGGVMYNYVASELTPYVKPDRRS